MFQRVLIGGFLAILAVTAVSGQGPQPQRTVPRSDPSSNVAAPRAVLDKYCVGCHNARLKTGGLALDELDLSRLADHAAIGEKVALKLRAGMMPPARSPRPDRATLDGLITWMENELDSHAVTNLAAPGIHRLNRTEYQNVIRDLIGLKIDPARFLPSDNSTHGFDNIAGALTMSPALMEAYLVGGGQDQPPGHGVEHRAHPRRVQRPRRRHPELPRRGAAVRHARRHADRARISGRRRVRVQDRPDIRRQHGAGERPVRPDPGRTAGGDDRRPAGEVVRLGQGDAGGAALGRAHARAYT